MYLHHGFILLLFFVTSPFLYSMEMNQPRDFYEWQKNCLRKTVLYKATKTLEPAVSQEQLLQDITSFTDAHKQQILAQKELWVKTSKNPEGFPPESFFSSESYQPYVAKKRVKPGTRIAIHGDLHGDVESFNDFLQHLTSENITDEKNPFKISDPNALILLLGDYTDRGVFGAEVISAVAHLKEKNPKQIYAVRGNHEDAFLNDFAGLCTELKEKYKDDATVFNKIEKMYQFLPSALYLQCEQNAMLACHGGPEFGFAHAQALLDAPTDEAYVLMNTFERKRLYDQATDECQKHLEVLARYDEEQLEDVTHPKPTDNSLHWADMAFRPKNDPRQCVTFDSNRGWTITEKFNECILKRDSTPTCQLRGVLRAHQHGPDTFKRILNEDGNSDPQDVGVAKLWLEEDQKQPAGKLWDNIVCTFCVAPRNEYKLSMQTFGILTTAAKYEDWHLEMVQLRV